MLGKELIGRQSEPIALKIKYEDARRFAEAIGVNFDDRVPATFVGTLLQASIPGVELPVPGMIHGEQKITYHRPLCVGDSLTYQRCIKDVYERIGKLGTMIFVVVEATGYNPAGELIFTSSSVLIAPTKGGEE